MSDKAFVFDLIKALENSSIMEISYENEEGKIYISRRQQIPVTDMPPALVQPYSQQQNIIKVAATEETQQKTTYNGKVIKSPIVGTFYSAPAPDAEPYVTVGKRVHKGDTLCIVEAMKMMNEVESEFDGEVAEIIVQNKEAVEFGQVLMILK